MTATLAAALSLFSGCSSGPASTADSAAPGGDSKESLPADGSYAGSAACRECHEVFYERWAPSHHGLAMQPYTDEFASSELTPPSEDLALGGNHFRAEIGPGQGWVLETVGGRAEKHPIAYVLGGKNIYYFLTPMAKGRLQTLPVAFDVHRKEWFDTAASGVRHFPGEEQPADAPIVWTDWQYTFNTACYSCHVSQLAINYDPASDSYHTAWREPGIACETCHGPADKHVKAARTASKDEPMTVLSPNLGVIRVKTMEPGRRSDLCATCHAKMTPLTASFKPGDRFFDHFDLATLEDPDFYPDGRDLGENYTYTTWLMSPCAQSGELDCVHCHTSSGRYRFKDENFNDACMPCHANKVRDPVSHTHHPAGSEASRCISCHMPMTSFARMERSDHSMRPPAPAATEAFKSPNACNSCHRDKSAAWADRYVREWRSRDYQAPILRLGRMVEAARKQDWKHLPEILDYIVSPDRQEIFATSLIRLIAGCPDPKVPPVLLEAMQDPSPLVRSAAAEALQFHLTPAAVDALLRATGDDYRLVRIRAAAGLLEYPRRDLQPADAERLARATDEYLAFIRARPDQWPSHYNVGNYYLAKGDLSKAVDAFEQAIRIEPRAIMPLINASIAHARLGEMKRSEELLRQALRFSPKDAAANFNLGLLEAEQGNAASAEQHLRTALRSNPQMSEAAYNLGLLIARDRLNEAIRLCAKAYHLRPSSKYGYTLAYLFREKGDFESAIRTLSDLIHAQPADADSYLLLADIYARTGRLQDLSRLLEQARSENLGQNVRSRIDAMLQAADRRSRAD
jgi:tetratricopeptide (TPR) repeat protein